MSEIELFTAREIQTCIKKRGKEKRSRRLKKISRYVY
jgi:hypothetical protein